jgi:tripeptidyl-peptidase-1
MKRLLILSILLTLVIISVVANDSKMSWIFRDRQRRNEEQRNSFISLGKVKNRKEVMHKLTIAIKLLNMDVLEQIFQNVSNPDHEDYGKYWTREKIGDLIKNKEALKATEDYLKSQGIEILNITPNGEFVEAAGNIDSWEKIFQTEFFEYQPRTQTTHKSSENLQRAPSSIYRAKEYSLPMQLDHHIFTVFDLIDFPVESATQSPSPSPVLHQKKDKTIETAANTNNHASIIPGFVTPALLNKIYNISTNYGSEQTSQGILLPHNQYISPTDLNYFQQYFSLYPTQISLSNSIGNSHIQNNACSTTVGGSINCQEGNLQFQYLLSNSWKTPTSSYYNMNTNKNDPLHYQNMISFLASIPNPPEVIVITTIHEEKELASEYMLAFNHLAIQFGVLGTTIVVSSGNDGAVGPSIRNQLSLCSYNPQFPASSPYVLTVGSTEGPENGLPEIGASWKTNNQFSSGGGFSLYHPVPSWQQAAVSGYHSKSPAPYAGYALAGRGYPDISAVGNKFLVSLGQSLLPVSSTSASTVVIAGMISAMNAERKKIGKPSLGFFNPLLYSLSNTIAIKDITMGKNNCTSVGPCCKQGFPANTGWDPITGLGVLNFYSFFSQAVYDSWSPRPSARPTGRPAYFASLQEVQDQDPDQDQVQETPAVSEINLPDSQRRLRGTH